MSSGTQKVSNVRHPYLRILFSGSVHVLIQVHKWDYFKNPSQELKISFSLGFLWIPKKTGQHNWRGPIFLRFNLVKQRTPMDPNGSQRTPADPNPSMVSLKVFIKCIPSILFTAQMQGMLGLWFRISVYQFARFLYVFFLVASKTSMQAWAWW